MEIFEFPKLTGEYRVGFQTRYLFDRSRKEPHNPSEQRELMLYIWYPAAAAKDSVSRYAKEEVDRVRNYLEGIGFSEESLAGINKISAHAIKNVQPMSSNTEFPVIIFSHGYLDVQPTSYTSLCENLASHGYVVVSIAHTYYAGLVTFPDGRTIPADPEKYTGKELFESPETSVGIRTADVKAVLNYLDTVVKSKSDILAHLFSMDRIGLLGHSFGGITSFVVCVEDERVKAGIALDSMLIGVDYSIADMKKPFLFIWAQGSIDIFKLFSDEELAVKYACDIELLKGNRKVFEESYAAPNRIVIPNIEHDAFTDLVLIKEVPSIKRDIHFSDLVASTGLADGFEVMATINKKIVEFFDNNM